MLLFFNDLSIHNQFHDISTFKKSIHTIMALRKLAKKHERQIYCHRSIVSANVSEKCTMIKALQHFDKNEKRSIMQWITRDGPFWEEYQNRHSSDEYMECQNKVVTETGLAEAAFQKYLGTMVGSVSLEPSDWLNTPILINWIRDNNNDEISIDNYWSVEQLKSALDLYPKPIKSWDQLKKFVSNNFNNLTIAYDAFAPLNGHPFVSSASERLINIFNILNILKTCFDSNGTRTPKGHQLYGDFFTGKKGDGGRGAIFSDSSDDEKAKFKKKLTFKHPEKPGESIFCPWHGKTSTRQLRVHFSWPIKSNIPLYIVYVGPKITKK
jgi:hypothetical protein